MKVKEILHESEPRSIDIDGVISQIKRNCGQFLSETRVPMYRGMSAQLNPAIFSTVQTPATRGPRDTPGIINTYIVKWFQDNTGLPFRKEHTLFATGSRKEAEDYGRAFLVFPIGQFEYCWSPVYKDLTLQFEHMQMKHYSTAEIQQEVHRVISNGNYEINYGLQQAIQARKEIMIYCKEYYILDYDAIATDYRTRIDVQGFLDQVFG